MASGLFPWMGWISVSSGTWPNFLPDGFTLPYVGLGRERDYALARKLRVKKCKVLSEINPLDWDFLVSTLLPPPPPRIDYYW